MSNTALTSTLPSFPTAEELSAAIQQGVQRLNSLATNYNVGGLTRTYIEAIALALGSNTSTLPGSTILGAYEILALLRDAMYLTTATGQGLRLKCLDLGVTAKGATAALVSVVLTSQITAPAGGQSVPAGTLLQATLADPTAAPVTFITTGAQTIPAGTLASPPISAIATVAGAIGNVPAGAVTAVISGPTSYTCFNAAPAAGGTDDESDNSLRARGLSAVANASQCTLSALIGAALTYPGITTASYKDLTAPDGVTKQLGSCLIFCDDGSGDLGNPTNPNHGAVIAFQQDLTVGKWRAAGVTVTALGSLLQPVTISVLVDIAQSWLNVGYSVASVLTAVRAALYAYMEVRPLGGPVRIADIVEFARPDPGVSNVIVSSVIINGMVSDLLLPPQYVARCVNGIGDITTAEFQATTYN